eukprot:SAG22_NODE_16554_length_323_cov_0.446429_1_plen_49_part_10
MDGGRGKGAGLGSRELQPGPGPGVAGLLPGGLGSGVRSEQLTAGNSLRP